MHLDPAQTELTTAATDLIVAAAAIAGIGTLLPFRHYARFRARVWIVTLGALATGGVVGAAVHGLVFQPSFESLLWWVISLSLGIVVSGFAVAVVDTWRGQASALAIVPYLAAAVVMFLIATEMAGGSFLPTVVFEAVVMTGALAICLSRVREHAARDARALALGIILTIMAAGFQALGLGSFSLIWAFDHNGTFHLVQLVAVVPLVVGMRWGLIDLQGSIGTGQDD